MSTPLSPSFVVQPDLRATLDAFKVEILYDLNSHEVGQIVSFNPTTQTASVQIMVKARILDQIRSYPVLTDCPVFSVSGGAGCLTMPVAAGDPCLVLFNDRDMDGWFATGIEAEPNTTRAHSLSDGLVLVGFRNLANPISSYSATDVELRNALGKVVVKANGETKMASSVANLTLDASGLLAMSNAAGSLRTAMDAIITALSALNSVKSGGTAATQITSAQNALNNILNP